MSEDEAVASNVLLGWHEPTWHAPAMKDDENIDSLDALREWLNGQPVSWAQVIALRAALRALPLIADSGEYWLKKYAPLPFAAVMTSWIQLTESSINIFNSGFRANQLFVGDSFDYSDYKIETLAANAADASYHLADAQSQSIHIYNDCLLSVTTAEQSFRLAAIQTGRRGENGNIAAAMIMDSVEIDCQRCSDVIMLGDTEMGASKSLATFPLWDHLPALSERYGEVLAERLGKIDSNFSVWIEWYDRRVRGERAAFDIPGDKDRTEDKAILRRLAEATDHDFWGKGHAYVNAELTRWLEEARVRAASQVQYAPSVPPQGPEQIAAALLRQASPQARITDGQLDAGPNTVFDQPQYSDNLAELPSELLAFTGVILNSLPRNCEAVVRHCFAAFRDELLARGNRPIVNILKAMAASLIAELYGAEQAPLSPDLRQLKDPREWGDGMAAMFAQFFAGYHDLIHHFPLDPEREALIAATPINEAAASGAALTEPVDAVAALILELGKQGFATDNIVRIIEAHQLYNRDVAQLPPPGQASQAITPKRRHVLSTAGFYLHTYSVLGSTASIYALQTVPAVQALMLQLERAANALLAFVQ